MTKAIPVGAAYAPLPGRSEAHFSVSVYSLSFDFPRVYEADIQNRY
jgi:hypothetical protein